MSNYKTRDIGKDFLENVNYVAKTRLDSFSRGWRHPFPLRPVGTSTEFVWRKFSLGNVGGEWVRLLSIRDDLGIGGGAAAYYW